LRPVTRHIRLKLLVMLLLLPFTFILCVSVGDIHVPISDIFKSLTGQNIENPSNSVILYTLRIPEALTAMICAGALAVSGLIMQSYFRNPLAGPAELGISTGSSFGIVLLLVIFPGLINGGESSHLILILFASLGALGVLVLLSLIRFRIRHIETLLIAGLLIGYFLSSCSTMLLSNTNAENIKAFVYWGFGSFSKTGYTDIAVLGSIILVLWVVTLFMSRSLDAFQFSDETIANTGINRHRSGYALMMLSGIICAVVTAYCGPIAFLGMCVPHVARMYLKTSRHLYLTIGCMLIAANIGLICATISRLSFFGQNLPINSVTSFLGAPFILYILFSNRQKRHA
jgi:iron complex transport system permease protein